MFHFFCNHFLALPSFWVLVAEKPSNMRTRPRASTASTKEGGPGKGRLATPPYNSEGLAQALAIHVDSNGTAKAFDLGAYWSIPTSYAVRGAGLLYCFILLELFVVTVPTCYLWFADLRKCFQNLCMSRPALLEAVPKNMKVSDPSDYGSVMADRIMCLMAHLRRLKLNAKKWQSVPAASAPRMH